MSREKLIRLGHLGYKQISLSDGAIETLRFAGFLKDRFVMRVEDAINAQRTHIAHFGVHRPRDNAGDAVLFDAIEKLFDWHFGRQNWVHDQLRLPTDDAQIDRINRRARAVLVGGGGLLISDTNPNGISGWQWRISKEQVNSLKAPLVVFAIGFNQFRGAGDFNDTFQDHLIATVRKSIFFGMRNVGSIRRTREYLPSDLHDKVVYQPCMTTVLSRFHPRFNSRPEVKRDRRIALNLAFDRARLRFGAAQVTILNQILAAVVGLNSRGWSVDLVLHGWSDEPAAEFFRNQKVDINFVYLNLRTPNEIIDYYRSIPITIGMRGHAQMIPFGCCNAVYSLISHDKMKFFLDDINQPDWGVEISDPNISTKIFDFVDKFENDSNSILRKVETAKDALWSITCNNLECISI